MKKFFVVIWVLIWAVTPIFSQESSETSETTDAEPKRWPREIDISNAVITVYQPQLETFENNQLTCRAAVAVKRNKNENTDYCSIWMKADVDTDKEARTVKLKDLEVTKIAYPDVSDKVKESLGGIISRNILKADFTISLDRLLAMLDVVEKQEKSESKLESPVPEFFFSKEPAVLVNIDGEPVLRDMGKGISQIANTRFLIAFDNETKKYYLKCAGRWFFSDDLKTGWVPTTPSEQIKALEDKDAPDETIENDDVIPKIFVSTKAAELIQCNGEPELAQIPETNLSYLANSDNDIFRDTENDKLYILASGRWFTADQKEGPWSFIASDKLPKDFSEIPDDSPKANVLASITGTQEAQDAVMESYIPQTATIKRGSVTLDIVYDGEPAFEAIEGTSMSYAVNTQTPVVKVNNKYYACDNAAWYVSESPKGNWDVCTEVPDEIYNIPPSCPIYNATFVKVYDYDDDSVDVGYTSGYDDSYIYGGTIVYGTGYWYRRWCRHHWWPRPVTYGCRFRYNHHIGRWDRYDRYRNRNGAYVAWNNRHNPKIRKLPNHGVGNYRGKQHLVAKHNAYKYNKGTIKKADVARKIPAAAKRPTTSQRHVANNVYAGKDGKIYRHGLDGWQQQNKGKWQTTKPTTRPTKPITRPTKPITRPTKPVTRPTKPVTRPTTRPSSHDLNRHYQSRQRSNTRHSSASRSRASFSRGRSGGSRGGGRRR